MEEKEKKQVVALTVVLAAIAGVVIYLNIDRLKPHPSGSVSVPPQTSKLQLNVSDITDVIARRDYLDLNEFGAVPVRVVGLGSDKPFVSLVKETER